VGKVKISSVRSATVNVVGYAPSADTSACLYDSGAPYFSTPSGTAPLLVSVESNGPDCPPPVRKRPHASTPWPTDHSKSREHGDEIVM
jgi:hypothetical protein